MTFERDPPVENVAEKVGSSYPVSETSNNPLLSTLPLNTVASSNRFSITDRVETTRLSRSSVMLLPSQVVPLTLWLIIPSTILQSPTQFSSSPSRKFFCAFQKTPYRAISTERALSSQTTLAPPYTVFVSLAMQSICAMTIGSRLALVDITCACRASILRRIPWMWKVVGQTKLDSSHSRSAESLKLSNWIAPVDSLKSSHQIQYFCTQKTFCIYMQYFVSPHLPRTESKQWWGVFMVKFRLISFESWQRKPVEREEVASRMLARALARRNGEINIRICQKLIKHVYINSKTLRRDNLVTKFVSIIVVNSSPCVICRQVSLILHHFNIIDQDKNRSEPIASLVEGNRCLKDMAQRVNPRERKCSPISTLYDKASQSRRLPGYHEWDLGILRNNSSYDQLNPHGRGFQITSLVQKSQGNKLPS